MKPLFFKLVTLLLVINYNSSCYSQTVISERLFTCNNKTLKIEGSDSNIRIEKSKDDQVHALWVVTSNMPEQVKETFHQGNVSKIKYGDTDNTINIKAKNILTTIVYADAHQSNFSKIKEDKSVDSLYFSKKEIIEKIQQNKSLFEKIAITDTQDNNENYYIKDELVVKIPDGITTTINGTRVSLDIKDNVTNTLHINLEDSSVKAVSLTNQSNSIHIKNGGYFIAEHLEIKNISLENINTVLIGRLENTTLQTSFSKIRIGEIGPNNHITDQSSKIYFYNFSHNFKNLLVTSEYSYIVYFTPDIDYNLSVYGKKNTFKSSSGSVNVNSAIKADKILAKYATTPNPAGDITFNLTNCTFYIVKK